MYFNFMLEANKHYLSIYPGLWFGGLAHAPSPRLPRCLLSPSLHSSLGLRPLVLSSLSSRTSAAPLPLVTPSHTQVKFTKISPRVRSHVSLQNTGPRARQQEEGPSHVTVESIACPYGAAVPRPVGILAPRLLPFKE